MEIKQEEIEEFSRILSAHELKPVPGTLSEQQVKAEKEGVITVRDVSCTYDGSVCCRKENPSKTVGITSKTNGWADNRRFQREPPKCTKKETDVSDRSTVKQIDYAKELKDLQKCKTYEKVKQKVSKIKLPSVQGKKGTWSMTNRN